MSALIPDERFDVSAIDAIEEAHPTPPSPSSRRTMVVIADESGPLDSYFPGGKSWKHIELPELLQLMKTAHLGLTILKVEWAARPELYSPTGADVLLVSIPGTHQVSTAKPRTYPKRKPAPIAHEPWDPSELDVHEARTYWSRGGRTVAPAVPKAERSTTLVVNTCPCCGTAHTEASWELLPLLSAKEHREGGMLINEVMRNCTCGSTRMVVTQRVAA